MTVDSGNKPKSSATITLHVMLAMKRADGRRPFRCEVVQKHAKTSTLLGGLTFAIKTVRGLLAVTAFRLYLNDPYGNSQQI